MKKYLILTAALWVGFFSMPVLQTGCTTAPDQRVNAYQTLRVVGQSAKASMDAATSLLKSGTITVDQWSKVATVYDTQFQPSYAVSVSAAQSNLDSFASPELINIAGQLAVLVTQLTAK